MQVDKKLRLGSSKHHTQTRELPPCANNEKVGDRDVLNQSSAVLKGLSQYYE